jgi:hypothetical protein
MLLAAAALALGGVALARVVASTTGAGACCQLVAGERTDPSRADCPGQIRCPLTGEWACEDRCPAPTSTTARR